LIENGPGGGIHKTSCDLSQRKLTKK